MQDCFTCDSIDTSRNNHITIQRRVAWINQREQLNIALLFSISVAFCAWFAYNNYEVKLHWRVTAIKCEMKIFGESQPLSVKKEVEETLPLLFF